MILDAPELLRVRRVSDRQDIQPLSQTSRLATCIVTLDIPWALFLFAYSLSRKARCAADCRCLPLSAQFITSKLLERVGLRLRTGHDPLATLFCGLRRVQHLLAGKKSFLYCWRHFHLVLIYKTAQAAFPFLSFTSILISPSGLHSQRIVYRKTHSTSHSQSPIPLYIHIYLY